MNLSPHSTTELQEIVRSNPAITPIGGGTKPVLSATPEGFIAVDMGQLSGLIEYEPGEFTFTAYAGTAVSEIIEALEVNGQYLPFDPLFVKQGTTLGGTVAANTPGSGRYRYGGVRDFILGVAFVDGRGRLLRSGGKVVKNAAGFDLPKFMVGSLGHYGILAELTFKVFPRPHAYSTTLAAYEDVEAARQAMIRLFPSPYELDALDLVPAGPEVDVLLVLRQGGLPDALPARRQRLGDFLQAETAVLKMDQLDGPGEIAYWDRVNAFNWTEEDADLVKVPVIPDAIHALEQTVGHLKRRYTSGGQLAWFSTTTEQEFQALTHAIEDASLSGLRLRGRPGQSILGQRPGRQLAHRVKQALDPEGKFPEK